MQLLNVEQVNQVSGGQCNYTSEEAYGFVLSVEAPATFLPVIADQIGTMNSDNFDPKKIENALVSAGLNPNDIKVGFTFFYVNA